MSFKDLIKKDVQKIFMNPDEFSEIHNINGKDMPIQIDANEQIEREKRQKREIFFNVSPPNGWNIKEFM
mgnify:CR=1 FL=1